MTEDERIARLTELARRVWSDADLQHGKARAMVETSAEFGNAIDIQHPRALDALEGALLVLAGDVVVDGNERSLMRPDIQRIVQANVDLGMRYTELLLELEQLAREWERDAVEYDRRASDAHAAQTDLHGAYCAGKSAGRAACAAELRQRARGKP